MSITDTTTVPVSTPPPAGRARTGGRIVAIVIGAVLAVSGFFTGISGAALLAVFGDGHAVASGNHIVTTSSAAVVADLGTIHTVDGFRFLTGQPTLQVTAQNLDGTAVFVGVGRTADVERYLDGVGIDRVTDVETVPFRLDTTRDDGAARAAAPDVQDFWVAAAQSGDDRASRAEVTWPIQDGDFEIVVLNADGSPGLLTTASVGAGLPDSTGLWILLIGVGSFLLVGGVSLIVVGARRSRRQ
ncbi:hypothetical protein [Nakamurella sp.]|uniref:hypothetical protein n=1 Tax=Nakamurella sp. TaxID=1869182 RepID=UPI0037849886